MILFGIWQCNKIAGHLMEGRSWDVRSVECGKEEADVINRPELLSAEVRGWELWLDDGLGKGMLYWERSNRRDERQMSSSRYGEEDSGSRWVISWWQEGGSHRNVRSLPKQKHPPPLGKHFVSDGHYDKFVARTELYKVGRCLARYSPRAEAINAIPCNTVRYNTIQCNTIQHRMKCNTMQYNWISCNKMQYNGISCNKL